MIAGPVGVGYLGLKVVIKFWDHYGVTINNEIDQASIMAERHKVQADLMASYRQQTELVEQFQGQFKDKGCDTL